MVRFILFRQIALCSLKVCMYELGVLSPLRFREV
jgi:hypothetical protein